MKQIILLFCCLAFTACGGGGGSSAPNTSAPPPVSGPAPTPPAAPDLTQAKLLSDDEMETQPLSPVPAVNSAYADWLEDNHFPIRSVTYDQDFSDLAFLQDMIGNRSIVQLGESSHGTREFNYAKTRLIKFLHQTMDYNVIAFESGFFGGVFVDERRETASSDALMRFIFPVWQTDEVFELFEYVRETQSGSNPLRLAGFDVQISSGYYARIVDYIDTIPVSGDWTEDLRVAVRRDLEQFRELQISFSQSGCFGATASTTICDDIIEDMEALQTRLSDHEAEIDAIANPSRDIKVISIATFAAKSQMDGSKAAYQGRDSRSVRDRNMATTFDRVKADLFPDEKIIIWAHNRHVAHFKTETESSGPFLIGTPLGSFLKSTYPDELFTIGFYMLRGQTANTNEMPVPVVQPPNDSFEAIAHSVRKAALFVDTRAEQDQVAGNRFLFEPTETMYWGGSFGTYGMVPSEHFDGIIVIDQSSTPAYR